MFKPRSVIQTEDSSANREGRRGLTIVKRVIRPTTLTPKATQNNMMIQVRNEYPTFAVTTLVGLSSSPRVLIPMIPLKKWSNASDPSTSQDQPTEWRGKMYYYFRCSEELRDHIDRASDQAIASIMSMRWIVALSNFSSLITRPSILNDNSLLGYSEREQSDLWSTSIIK